MSWSKWRGGVSRRAFLGGASVTLALPFLPSLSRRAHAAGPDDVRLLWWYVPCGMVMPAWTPDGEGLDWTPNATLEPLEAHRDHLTVLTGLDNAPAHVSGVPGDHARGTGAFLTCRTPYKTEGADIDNGISVDQVAAGVIGGDTPFPSLQLGTSGGASVGNCDSGYSCAYARNISWAGPATPLPKTTSPRLVFERLFAGYELGLTEEERARRLHYRTSILDAVMNDANRLHGRLSVSDRAKVDEYLTGVRELELRITTGAEAVCDPPVFEDPGSFEETVRLMLDLTVAAFQCQSTRLVTLMQGNGGDGRNYDFLGISGGHHALSHHQNDPQKLADLRAINRWEVEQVAYLMDRMAAIGEGEGTLLDNALIYFGSECADGNSHSHFDQPVLLAGGGAGHVRPGEHRVYDEGRPVADLFLTMLQSVGVEEASFGADSTGPLDLS